MKKYEENPKPIYIPHDLLEEIFLRLPFKSLVKFKSVSREWRSIIESKRFIEMHLSLQKSGKTCQKIIAARHCHCGAPPSLFPRSRFSGNEEFVDVHCDANKPWMSCDGLVCIPEQGWINVLNPSTRQLWRFSSAPVRDASLFYSRHKLEIRTDRWTYFPGYCSMGFGRDKVRGSYKVVRLFFDPSHCEILDLDIGEWRKLNPPPYEVEVGRRTACVDGSIYWFDIVSSGCKILALDLHTEEFYDVAVPAVMGWKMETQIVNLEDRLALVTAQLKKDDDPYRKIRIWTMDAEEGTWSKTHSISLVDLYTHPAVFRLVTPVKVSMQGDVLFNSVGLLYKYNSLRNIVRQVSPSYRIAISPYLENLVRFQTDQLDLTTQSAYINGTTCHFKDGIASGRGISSFRSSVDDKFLRKEKSEQAYNSLWLASLEFLIKVTLLLFPSVLRG